MNRPETAAWPSPEPSATSGCIKQMNLETVTVLTAFALGFMAVGLTISAGVTLLETGYTIAPGRLHKLKTRALKHLGIAALAGATAAVLAMSI